MTVVFMQCIYAVISTTSQDAVLDIGRPIAVVAVPAPSQPGFDGETASFYAVEAEPEVNQAVDSIDDSVGENNELKRTLGMLRMGRAMRQRAEDEKRSMGMLRMGRSGLNSNDEERYISNNRDESNGEKRSMGMLRMGRSSKSDANEEKRSMGMLRMGRSSSRDGDRTTSEINEEKKSMAMLRMGRKR